LSDIFISYASKDRVKAKLLADALGQCGWSVWWDRHIPTGRSFDEVISEELDGARCVVVLWSRESVRSHWVKEEALEAQRRQVLVPALIEESLLPFGFRRVQTASLVDWVGDARHPGFEKLAKDIAHRIGSAVALISPGTIDAEIARPPSADKVEAPSRDNSDSVKSAYPATQNLQQPSAASATITAGENAVATDLTIDPETIRAVLRPYRRRDTENFHIAPAIPEKKLMNAKESCRVPKTEQVLAVIDLTAFMKHAKDCLLFSDRAIYYHKVGRATITYATLSDAATAVFANASTVVVGKTILHLESESKTDFGKLLRDVQAALQFK
jgi:hypothetical protein